METECREGLEEMGTDMVLSLADPTSGTDTTEHRLPGPHDTLPDLQQNHLYQAGPRSEEMEIAVRRVVDTMVHDVRGVLPADDRV